MNDSQMWLQPQPRSNANPLAPAMRTSVTKCPPGMAFRHGPLCLLRGTRLQYPKPCLRITRPSTRKPSLLSTTEPPLPVPALRHPARFQSAPTLPIDFSPKRQAKTQYQLAIHSRAECSARSPPAALSAGVVRPASQEYPDFIVRGHRRSAGPGEYPAYSAVSAPSGRLRLGAALVIGYSMDV